MLFGRIAAVEIHPDNHVEVIKPFRIEGLRISFEVKRTVKKNGMKASNVATIKIYNLSDDTRSKILEKNRKIVLLAGYEEGNGLELVFEGSIMTVNSPKQPPDVVTIIEANDGESYLREVHFSASYAEGTSAKRVLGDLIKAMGLPPAYVAKFQDKAFLQGFVHHGPGKDAMDKVCRGLGLEWSIQNGSMQILKEGEPDESAPFGILLTSDSGLIGSPERLKQIQDDPLVDKKPNGYTIKCLLQPTANPGSHIAVQSREIKRATAFRVEAVSHKGDTHGEEWQSEIEVYDKHGAILQ